jgi:hypothetical protein
LLLLTQPATGSLLVAWHGCRLLLRLLALCQQQ